jgi:hypothetical protein
MMKLKKTHWACAILGALFAANAALAAIASKVAVEGKIGNLTETAVELTMGGGTLVEVPRSGIRAKEADIRPGNVVIAVVEIDEIKFLPRRK